MPTLWQIGYTCFVCDSSDPSYTCFVCVWQTAQTLVTPALCDKQVRPGLHLTCFVCVWDKQIRPWLHLLCLYNKLVIPWLHLICLCKKNSSDPGYTCFVYVTAQTLVTPLCVRQVRPWLHLLCVTYRSDPGYTCFAYVTNSSDMVTPALLM